MLQIYDQYVTMAGRLKETMDSGHVLVLLSSLDLTAKLVEDISSVSMRILSCGHSV